jgi:putative flippase GtrA
MGTENQPGRWYKENHTVFCTRTRKAMTAILNNSRERIRFIRFAIVGTIGAVVDFGVMNLLVQVFRVSLVLAGTISFIAAILSNFTWNRYWTYPDSRSKSVLQQLIEFAIVSVVGLAIRVPILKYLEPVLERIILIMPLRIPILDNNTIADNLTLATAVIIVLFWNFFINRYWTYSDVK